MEWTPDQQKALELLRSPNNIFVTGGAGTGKSTVIQSYIQEQFAAEKNIAVLASTGTAAILLGGRTFHSYFGLGIMEGGVEQVLERATKHKGIVLRLKKTETILIDEISMIGAQEWMVAEKIARKARGNSAPWGGLRIIAVGDFTQLPPVVKATFQSRNFDSGFDQSVDQSPQGPEKPWCFLTDTWAKTEFDSIVLETIVRSHDAEWNEILNELRWGTVSAQGQAALRDRVQPVPLEFQGTRLFARRAQVEKLNHDRLHTLGGTAKEFNTLYIGNAQKVEELKRNAPIPEVLLLKIGALVMFRQNDSEYRFVNGTLGIVREFLPSSIRVELLSRKTIDVKQVTFSVLDAEGEPVATASNYPLNLAWASTIHKAQGATLDRAHVDLRGVWEHGQSYVALSRVRSLQDLTIEGMSLNAFKVDSVVREFYRRLKSRS